MWGRTVDGLVLVFHLAGINNQNFLMRDEQTGSYWQQITGTAISGPMRGRKLPLVDSDEVSFKVWSSEHPDGRVLAPVAKFAGDYEAKDWDKKMDRARTVIQFPKSGLPMREQVFGIATENASRAFPVKRVLAAKLVMDKVGSEPIILVTADDNLSVRAFYNLVPARDFYRTDSVNGVLFTDGQSGSKWDFRGCAVDGSAKGQCLKLARMIKDYWFDWKNYHPATSIFR